MPDMITTSIHGSYLMPSLERATVADAMHPGILTCEPDACVSEVAQMMATRHVHCIAVVGISHGSPECYVWGIVSDLDLLSAGISGETGATARDLANQPVVTVSATMPLREAGGLMLQRGVSHLVVSDPETQRPTGIISTLDVAGILAWGEA
jgi:CBS domain-containing protein